LQAVKALSYEQRSTYLYEKMYSFTEICLNKQMNCTASVLNEHSHLSKNQLRHTTRKDY